MTRRRCSDREEAISGGVDLNTARNTLDRAFGTAEGLPLDVPVGKREQHTSRSWEDPRGGMSWINVIWERVRRRALR